MSVIPPSTQDAFKALKKITQILRDPDDGCPWDKEQTHQSISSSLIEEAYETYQAILDFDADNPQRVNDLKEELGDLLFQVVFHAQMAQEKNLFTLEDVFAGIAEKLIQRHPHVFQKPETQAEKETFSASEQKNNVVKNNTQNQKNESQSASDTLKTWEHIKRHEKEKKHAGFVSMLASLPAHLPALQKAQRIGQKVARVNFDWPRFALRGKEQENLLLRKVYEELQELKAELPENIEHFDFSSPAFSSQDVAMQEKQKKQKEKAQEELGDLLFTLAQVSRHYHLDAEKSLYTANRKFTARFAFMEEKIHQRLLRGDALSASEWETLWQEAKKETTKEKKA